MYHRLTVWDGSIEIDTLYFSSDDKARRYGVRAAAVDFVEFDIEPVAEIPVPELDPEPPTVVEIFTITWDASTRRTTTSTRLADPDAAGAMFLTKPGAAIFAMDSTDEALPPLTKLRFADRIEGQYRRVTASGADKDCLQATLATKVAELGAAGKLTSTEILAELDAAAEQEHDTYIRPLSEAEAELQMAQATNFLGSHTDQVAVAEARIAHLYRDLRAAHLPAANDAQVVKHSGPRELVRVDTVKGLSAFPDGTVVVWHSREGVKYERQAGVLDTWNEVREIRPVSLGTYERNTGLNEVDPPVWVLTFDDPAQESEDGK